MSGFTATLGRNYNFSEFIIFMVNIFYISLECVYVIGHMFSIAWINAAIICLLPRAIIRNIFTVQN